MIFPLLFSCTQEENETITAPRVQSNLKVMSGYPENKANPFDEAGRLHNELCLAYESGPVLIATTQDAIEIAVTLAGSSLEFAQLTPNGYTYPSSTRLDFIFQSPNNLWHAVEQLPLTGKARISLTNFLMGVDSLKVQKSDYDGIYQFIIAYEDSVTQDTTFSSLDRQIIFTATSIARYSHHFASLRKKKPPRDKDWDANIGNIVAGTDASPESTAKAVIVSVAASLYSNR